MVQTRLSMIKIREVLHLRYEAQLSKRQIALAVGVSRSTVQQRLLRARAAVIAAAARAKRECL